MAKISFMNKYGKEKEALAYNMMQTNYRINGENSVQQFSSMSHDGLQRLYTVKLTLFLPTSPYSRF